MLNLLDHYRILGVTAGADIADVTSSYRRLCLAYHPDLNDDPESEEQMKRINIAYAVLRKKLLLDAAFRERHPYHRTARRHTWQDTRPRGAEQRGAEQRAGGEAAEKEAFAALSDYFKKLLEFDYSGAYNHLCLHDKRHISRESFIEWRASVARLYPMREFEITGNLPMATVTFKDGRTQRARRFRVSVTEELVADEQAQSGSVEKLVIYEHGFWKVFLGYKGVGELTRSFDERFENRRKRDEAKRWEEYRAGLAPEYDMLSLAGMRKAASREIYRQQRFGGALTFAAISVKADGATEPAREELLRSAAKTIEGALRETDVPAYAGDGVFAVLFVELRKKNVDEIINRLCELIRANAAPVFAGQVEIAREFESWQGNASANPDALNKILKKFHKSM